MLGFHSPASTAASTALESCHGRGWRGHGLLEIAWQEGVGHPHLARGPPSSEAYTQLQLPHAALTCGRVSRTVYRGSVCEGVRLRNEANEGTVMACALGVRAWCLACVRVSCGRGSVRVVGVPAAGWYLPVGLGASAAWAMGRGSKAARGLVVRHELSHTTGRAPEERKRGPQMIKKRAAQHARKTHVI